MECIICQDDTSESLQDNTFCDCKYKIHASCWIDYVHSKTTVICLLCRKERMESKKEIPTLPTIIEEQEQEPDSQNTVSSVQPSGSLWQTESSLRQPTVITNNDLNRKIIKLVICVIILVSILVLIWA